MVASFVAKDSVYINGISYDRDKFMKELQQIANHVQKMKKR